jgi:hypothetical protein
LQTTDAQVRKLLKEIRKTGKIWDSVLKAGVSRNIAANYVTIGLLPSEQVKPKIIPKILPVLQGQGTNNQHSQV